MNGFWLGIEKMVTENQPKIIILVIVALIITGVCMILPSEKLREKGKANLPWIVIGCAIVVLAAALANYLMQTFTQ